MSELPGKKSPTIRLCILSCTAVHTRAVEPGEPELGGARGNVAAAAMAEGLASLLEEFRTLTNSGISDSAIPSTERYGREYFSDQGHPGNENSSEKDGYFQPSLLTGMHALGDFTKTQQVRITSLL